MPKPMHATSDAKATKFGAPPPATPNTEAINNVICQDKMNWMMEVMVMSDPIRMDKG